MNGGTQHLESETKRIMVNDEKSPLTANTNKILTIPNNITNSNDYLRKTE